MKLPSHFAGRICALALASFSVPANAQLAKNSCKYLGNIITNQVPADFNNYWNQATPENSGKWTSIQSSVKSTSYSWSGFDVVYNWGKTTGNPVKFHTLVWGSAQPSGASSATIEDIQRWFQAVHDRYPDLAQIDVVNEAFPNHAPPQYRGVLKTAAAADGIPESEYDWIFEAFMMARKLWPDANKTKLIYNDFNTIEYDTEHKWQVAMCKLAKEQKIPIDAIGLQAHDVYKLSTSSVKAKIDAIAATGFPLYITEYDISETDDTKQKNIMAEQMTMFWNHISIKGVTYWGLRDGQTWRTGTGIFTSTGALRPSMQWLKDWIPAAEGSCYSHIEERPGVAESPAHPGLIVRSLDGRLETGVERNGQFTGVNALGQN